MPREFYQNRICWICPPPPPRALCSLSSANVFTTSFWCVFTLLLHRNRFQNMYKSEFSTSQIGRFLFRLVFHLFCVACLCVSLFLCANVVYVHHVHGFEWVLYLLLPMPSPYILIFSHCVELTFSGQHGSIVVRRIAIANGAAYKITYTHTQRTRQQSKQQV